MNTLYWHDYETWGTDPARDKPSQFAGIRTNEDLEIISDPLMVYCQPPADGLPHPMACLITGLTPQKARQEGVSEREFAAAIHRELSRPGTCGVGYNSLRFDDNVSRYLFYRNFFDPYEREWKNGNSRWDILDMVRLTYALRPEGIEWPLRDDGLPSFKLERLSAANGMAHDQAHDALSDVLATIELAKLIKAKQPRLYEYAYSLRHKNTVKNHIDVAQRKPFFHVSGMLPAERGCAGLLIPLAWHPTNSNEIIAFDLMSDPGPLLSLDAEQLREKLYTRTEDLPEGEERIGLKNIRTNFCPIVAPVKMLDAKSARRLKIDRQRCEEHWQQLQRVDLSDKLQQVFGGQKKSFAGDVETRLFDGFFQREDKALMADVRSGDESLLKECSFPFQDGRLQELFFRYKARNYPHLLSPQEQLQWQEHCFQRITEPEPGYLGIDAYFAEIETLLDDPARAAGELQLLGQLREYGDAMLAGG